VLAVTTELSLSHLGHGSGAPSRGASGVEEPGFCLWRRSDVELLADELSRVPASPTVGGLRLLPVDWNLGDGVSVVGGIVDTPPYDAQGEFHVRLQHWGKARHVYTSVLLIIVRDPPVT
jgi:hypothetical protein